MNDRVVRVVCILDTAAMGGTELYVTNLVRHLDARRFATTVVLSPSARDLPLGAALTRAGASVEYQVMPQSKRELWALSGLVRRLRSLSPQIVHVNLPFTLDNRYAFLAARLAACRVVVSTEHLAPASWVFQSPRARVVKRVLAALQTRIIAVSEDVRGRLISAAGIAASKIVTIHNGVELPDAATSTDRDGVRRELGVSPNTPLVGMVARIDLKQKRYDDFLAAARQVSVAVPDAHFLIVGDGEEQQRAVLKRIVQEAGLEDRVRFLGYRHDTGRIVAALDVFVLATSNEGFPFVTLEAMALGTPVVATDLAPLREQIVDGQSGYLVPPGNTNRLAEHVLTLLRDPVRARAMAARARRLVEQRFSAGAMAERTTALYFEMLARGRDTIPRAEPLQSKLP